MLDYPQIDPVIVQLGPVAIRWYGVAYVVGILGAAALFRNEFKTKLSMTFDDLSNFVSWVVLGILIGGRLGYVMFYNLTYYMQNPASIFAFWQGGMAYHGGALGAFLATLWYSRSSKKSFLSLIDILGIGSTIGIFCGRIANFINGELVGRITLQPWGMVFPGAGPLPRHPSQLYEAALEGVMLFIILIYIKKKWVLKPGQLFGFYCIGYGAFRLFLENFREPDLQVGLFFNLISMGQILSLVMIGFGIGMELLLKKEGNARLQ